MVPKCADPSYARAANGRAQTAKEKHKNKSKTSVARAAPVWQDPRQEQGPAGQAGAVHGKRPTHMCRASPSGTDDPKLATWFWFWRGVCGCARCAMRHVPSRARTSVDRWAAGERQRSAAGQRVSLVYLV